MNPRERREQLEILMIGPGGVRSADSKGRLHPDDACDIRTCFQQDVDRITHSKAFRRLKQKTQAFLQPEGDHYRTRLTHTLEVSRIARTLARALDLNEDLTEAISLGHDLGHAPFGHAGERALNEIMREEGGFRHYEQSLRVVDVLEKEGRGLNLTWEVRNGILRHTVDPLAATLEGQAVRLADRVAYSNHDIDDAVRAGIIREDELPPEATTALGEHYSARADIITKDIIRCSMGKDLISISPEVSLAVELLNGFLYERIYMNPEVKGEEPKVLGLLSGIFSYYCGRPERLPSEYLAIADRDGIRRAVCDYVSGMTDEYAIYQYNMIFLPAAWQVR